MAQPLRVLLVEDSQEDAFRLLGELRRGGFDPFFERVTTAEGMSLALARHSWDLVIADASLTHFPAPSALELLQRSGSDVPFILVIDTLKRNSRFKVIGSSFTAQVTKRNLKQFVSVVKRQLRSAGERQRRRHTDGMLRYLAEYDSLTKLPNRNLFLRQLEQAIRQSRRDSRPFAVLLMGLDRFKEINHTLGPKNGDLLLKEVAQRFESGLGGVLAKARLGGDEFAAILPGAGNQEAQDCARKILQQLERPFLVEQLPIDLSGSIGIALYPEHGDDSDLLCQRADVALYLTKQYGRDCAVYNLAEDPYSQQRLAILGGLRNAIAQNELVLHFQPKISIHDGNTTSVEALVRWQHPQMGLLYPDRFVPLAERTGLIHPLSLWVLQAALEQCRAWRDDGMDIPVAVNLSARNLHDHQLADRIIDLLKAYQLAPGSLEVEITESFIMADAAHALQVLTRLNEMGIRVHIDDFGTGYSSLGYLKRLPVDGIKIDKSFVLHMAVDENDSAIVRSTIELGHNLGLKVIAEGVESREILDRLRQWHCDGAQGYYISRPVPAESFRNWAAESAWGPI